MEEALDLSSNRILNDDDDYLEIISDLKGLRMYKLQFYVLQILPAL